MPKSSLTMDYRQKRGCLGALGIHCGTKNNPAKRRRRKSRSSGTFLFLAVVIVVSSGMLVFTHRTAEKLTARLLKEDVDPLWQMAMSRTTPTRSDEAVAKMVEWVRSRGGYVNPKIEFRRSNPSDPKSHFGIFAKEEVQPKEILLNIPPNCVLGLDLVSEAKISSNDDGRYYDSMCQLSHKLLDELKLGQDSTFAPYVQYLKEQSYGQLPATYSLPGQQLMEQIVGQAGESSTLSKGNSTSFHQSLRLPPALAVSWLSDRFSQCIDVHDPAQRQAVALVAQRGWDIVLCPLFDLVNHHNGAKLNTESTSVYDPNGFKVRASKAIEAGEEAYSTYDKCLDCGDTAAYWGTPEIFREYGFVENFPQRWIFKRSIGFELHSAIVDGVKSYEVTWMRKSYKPKKKDLEFLRVRFDQLKDVPLPEKDELPPSEWNAIMQYRGALEVALSAAMQVMERTLGSNSHGGNKNDDSKNSPDVAWG
ncbi:expressed unknown protein [Seminavis robusta]|uniref:SET domain-containing protein n=1 Tax=Seminavis robusta TaxID=568900 RepID=A0A9N8EKP9_9STRA|nr:expressed unknown protein [Seminavis robusta]|eukprot:Sro1428_g271840.1 n/a (476) ;mRNA; r:7016-8443